MLKILAEIVFGALLRILGAKYLFVGPLLRALSWGIAGLVLGAWCEKREALINGAIFGFVLAIVFMLVDIPAALR